jgi:galactosamine-6-phosphate isomerase
MDATFLRDHLRVEVTKDARSLGERAAAIVLGELRDDPALLLCASAGGTPTETYGCLAKQAQRIPERFSRLRILQIDEWAGLPHDHPATCNSDLRTKLVNPLRVSDRRYLSFRSDAEDPAAECERVSRWLAKNGPIDVCILGLGLNGHIAMNEPAASAQPHAHVATLAPGSRKHPLLQALPRKPRFGLTLGMGDILRSRKLLLLVSGGKKRATLQRLLHPGVTPRFPVSFLWLHPDATVLCDRAAAPESLQ